MKKKEITSSTISTVSSILAIIICVVAIIIEFVSKRGEYWLWLALLLLNVSSFISNRKIK